MKRKINLVGRNTLTISLPSKWAEKNGLSKGDELEVSEFRKGLLIQTDKKKPVPKHVDISIDGMPRYLVRAYLAEYYRLGVERLTIRFSSDSIDWLKTNEKVPLQEYIELTVNRFIGSEIVEQRSGKIVVQSLFSKEDQKIDVIERRIYFLFVEYLKDLRNYISKKKNTLAQTNNDQFNTIIKFINFYLRLLRDSDISPTLRDRLFALFSSLDHAASRIRHIGQEIQIHDCSSAGKKYLQSTVKFFESLFDVLFKKSFDVQDMRDVLSHRYRLFSELDTIDKKVDFKIVSDCKSLIDLFPCFLEVYTAKKAEQSQNQDT